MDDQTLKAFIVGILASGSGKVIQLLLSQIIKWRDEDGQPVASKTKRRLVLALSIAVPSALYGFIVWMTWVEYGVAAHVAYVGLALFTADALHGEKYLLDGKLEQAKKIAEAQQAGMPIKGEAVTLGITPWPGRNLPGIDPSMYTPNARPISRDVFERGDAYEGDSGDEHREGGR